MSVNSRFVRSSAMAVFCFLALSHTGPSSASAKSLSLRNHPYHAAADDSSLLSHSNSNSNSNRDLVDDAVTVHFDVSLLQSIESELSTRISHLQLEHRELANVIDQIISNSTGKPAPYVDSGKVSIGGNVIRFDEAHWNSEEDSDSFALSADSAAEIFEKIKAFLRKVNRSSIVLPSVITKFIQAVQSVPGLESALDGVINVATVGSPPAKFLVNLLVALVRVAVANGGTITVPDLAKAAALAQRIDPAVASEAVGQFVNILGANR